MAQRHNEYKCLSLTCYAGLRHTILEESPVHQMLVFVSPCFPPTTNRPVAIATNPLESEVTFKKNVVLIGALHTANLSHRQAY